MKDDELLTWMNIAQLKNNPPVGGNVRRSVAVLLAEIGNKYVAAGKNSVVVIRC